LRYFSLFLIACLSLSFGSCRRTGSEFVTVGLSEQFNGFNTLTTDKNDAAAERVSNLMFNSLVKKAENFDYVGDLASEINTSSDGKTITFVLRENVKFHNGQPFTSADVKYTFDQLFESKGFKSTAFFDTVPVAPGEVVMGPDGKPSKTKPSPHILSLETPDAKTVIFNLERPALRNQLLSNLVAIPIVAQGTVPTQKDSPIGTGPFRFVNFDRSQNTVELASFAEYWDGAPKVAKVKIKTVTDASALQNELQSGGVDLAPVPSNLQPDSLKSISALPNLKVGQFEGSNLQYLGMNTASAPLNNLKLREAIGYAIDREKIVKELLLGQATVAHSILPVNSWSYSEGVKYGYEPEKARQLIKESGYKDERIKLSFASGNAAFNSFAQVIQSSLREVGLNVDVDPVDPQTLRDNLKNGQFQMNIGVWIGGNQDPIFLKDLFTTGRIPGDGVACCNRGRYSDPGGQKGWGGAQKGGIGTRGSLSL